jgi:flagellar basal body-associated protein FliL
MLGNCQSDDGSVLTFILIAVAVVIVIIGIVGFVIYLKKRKPTKRNNTEQLNPLKA